MVAFDIVLLVLDQRLEATGGPSILGLEFAGSGFMLSYGTFFALAALATRDFARERGLRLLAIAGIATPFFAGAAALFDAAENIGWLLVLGGRGRDMAPPFSTICASLKFLLIGLAITYVLWGLIARLLRRVRSGDGC
jgi:ABC-type dipeptide/oligopeptide/nickel transport system permease component